MQVGGWKIRCSFPSFMSSKERIVLWQGGGLQLEVEHVFLREKVFTAKKKQKKTSRAAAAQVTLRTCFDLDQAERFFFFFCFSYPRVKFEVEFAPRSRLVSLISLLRPFFVQLWHDSCANVAMRSLPIAGLESLHAGSALVNTVCCSKQTRRKKHSAIHVPVCLLCVGSKNTDSLSGILLALMDLSNAVDFAWLF